jgi:MoxR-like ATPase
MNSGPNSTGEQEGRRYSAEENGDQSQESTLIRLIAELHLSDEQLSPERRSNSLFSIDNWLMGINPPYEAHESLQHRESLLEEAWVALERKRIASEEGLQEMIITPSQERLMKWLEDELEGEQGGSVFIHGIPGTGKSVFTEVLAKRLARKRKTGFTKFTAQPMTTSLELMARTLTDKKELYSTILLRQINQLREQPENATSVVDLLMDMLKKKTEGWFYYSDQIGEVYQKFLGSMGLTTAEFHQTGNPTSGLENWVKATIDQSGGTQAVLNLLTTAFTKREFHEKGRGEERIDKGIVFQAIEQDGVILGDEVDKMNLNGFSQFGNGLEDVLQTHAGAVITTPQGLSTTIGENFLFLATANDINKIPDNIQRRFHLVKFEPRVEDLVWQARILLSNEQGKSVLEGKQEHELATFLLFWEAFGRHRNVAFNMNALTTLCNKMRKGVPFIRALDQLTTAYAELQPVIAYYVEKGNTQLSQDAINLDEPTTAAEARQLTLSELNWQANKHYFGGEGIKKHSSSSTTEQAKQLFDQLEDNEKPAVVGVSTYPTGNGKTTLQLMTHPEVSAATGTLSGNTYMEHEIDVSSDNDQLDIISSPMGQSSLISTGKGVQAIDLPTGSLLAIDRKVIDQGGQSKKEEWGKNRNLLAAQWLSETTAVVITESTNKTLELSIISKNLEVKNERSVVWSPAFEIKRSMAIDSRGSSETPTVTIENGVILINWGEDQQSAFICNPESANQPFVKITIPENKKVHVRSGALGSFVFTDSPTDTQVQTTWLRTS